jgi:hypothetical protein
MAERAFKDGYIAGWRWIRGNNDVPTVPASSIPAGETAYRTGIVFGIRDACDLSDKSDTKSEDINSILGRALNQKPEGDRHSDG